ncbi:response regulator [Chroococcus sp. FPU101]|uniref:response regulator n=1 Tax=Chroococcus sp. FPU101 TaxID=1974212 RepID=UPI001A8DCC56|nr:response regulator [Chroococcus sp. FPU101]GFE69812.1 response regulator receiver modulated GAF sensor protein [Chroococcus sp. FPU101]
MKTKDTATDIPLILIVDDDRATRTLLRVAMEEEGYRVIEAKDGQQCLIEYHRYHPNMILLDAVMPEMDGFTCCEELRKNDNGEQIPILMITALDDQDSIAQAFTAGAVDYITKPIHWAVLAQRVKRLLATNQALQQLESLQDRLQKQEQWTQLFEQITQSFQLSDLSLETILTQTRNIAQADRVIFYSFNGTTRLEVTKKDILSTQELSLPNLGLNKYESPETLLAIADLLACHLPEKAITSLVQLQTRAILRIPLFSQASVWGLLCIHHCHTPYHWQDWEIVQFRILANLLTNIISYS